MVRGWLYVGAAGAVRAGHGRRRDALTGSGLSITEWKPIHGVIPPLNQAEWQEEFEKYQQIPQYEQLNKGMTLEEFKAHLLVGMGASHPGARRRLSGCHAAGCSSG